MPYHVLNLSEQAQWRWSAFSERKAVNLLKFWMYSLLITLLRVYKDKQWTCSLCFQRAGSERWRCHDWERRTLALTRRVQTAEHEDGRRADRSLSMNWIWASALCMQSHGILECTWCSHWVPRLPIHIHMWGPSHVTIAETSAAVLYNTAGDAFFRWIVESNETWCHHSEPTEKSPGMQWRHRNSPRPKKSRPQTSAVKIMLTVLPGTDGLQLFWTSNYATTW